VGRRPYWLRIFCSKAAFSVAYSPLCAFAINENGTDNLSSAFPLSKFLDPPLYFHPIIILYRPYGVYFDG